MSTEIGESMQRLVGRTYPHCSACHKVLEDCGCDGPQGAYYPESIASVPTSSVVADPASTADAKQPGEARALAYTLGSLKDAAWAAWELRTSLDRVARPDSDFDAWWATYLSVVLTGQARKEAT